MNPPLAYTPFFDAILENFPRWGSGMLMVLVIDVLFIAALILLLIAMLFLPKFKFRQPAFAVFKRNFVGYFNAPIGYVFLCLFVFLTSLAAFWPHEFFASNLANLDQLNWWLPLIMLVFIPAITMSVWADERRQGTDELVLTLPATDYEIVIGKYFACVGVFTVSLLFSQIWNYAVLAALTAGTMDIGLIMTTYLGYWFIGIAMLAIGMVASFMTRNLTIAFLYGLLLNAPLACLSKADLLLPNSERLSQLQQWGLLEQFDSFGRGVVTIAPVFYFVGIAVLGVYVSLVMIGRRHWSGATDGVTRLAHYLVRIACIVAITIGLTLIGRYTFLHQMRSDRSEGRVSSLSDETRAILERLSKAEEESGTEPSPILIDAYVSDNVPPEYVRTRHDLVSLLREFDALGGDRISVNLHTGVEPFSEDAVTAEKSYNITPVPVSSESRGMVRTEKLLMGASFRCGLERVTIPFFAYGTPVEYELIRSIDTVATTKRKRIGVLKTPANLMGGAVFDGRQYVRVEKQEIITELEKQYEVVEVDPSLPIEVWQDDSSTNTENSDASERTETTSSQTLRHSVLIVAQPSALSATDLKNLLVAIEEGQPVVIFEDPFSGLIPVLGTDTTVPGQIKCEIKLLWQLLGIEPDRVVGRSKRESQLCLISSKQNPYPQIEDFANSPETVFVRLLADQPAEAQELSQLSPITAGLEELIFPLPGAIHKVSSDVDFEPLVVVQDGGVLGYDDWYATRDNIRNRNAWRQRPPEGEEKRKFVLAAEIKSAEKPGAATASKKKGIHAVYVADLDSIATDIVMIWRMPTYRDRGTVFRMQNTIFVLNMIDYMANEGDKYIGIRTRQRGHKTLRRIEQLIEKAQDDVTDSKQEKQKFFERKINEARNKLSASVQDLTREIDALKARDNVDPNLIRLKENQRTLKTEAVGKQLFSEQERLEREKEQEIREIERNMELDIQRMQTDFKIWSAFLPPIIPMIIGFIVYAKRRLLEREGVSKARLK